LLPSRRRQLVLSDPQLEGSLAPGRTAHYRGDQAPLRSAKVCCRRLGLPFQSTTTTLGRAFWRLDATLHLSQHYEHTPRRTRIEHPSNFGLIPGSVPRFFAPLSAERKIGGCCVKLGRVARVEVEVFTVGVWLATTGREACLDRRFEAAVRGSIAPEKYTRHLPTLCVILTRGCWSAAPG
jgi:hypothetical protein